MLHIDVLCHAALYIVRYIRDVANQIVIYICLQRRLNYENSQFV